jgi:hypothetical protein
MGKFTGVAYFTVRTTQTAWFAKALPALDAVSGLAQITYEPLPDRDEMTITINGVRQDVVLISGRGQGVVKESAVAGAMISCLLAISKKAGDMTIVDDQQRPISKVAQANAVFAGSDWALTQAFADVLELTANQAFRAKHAGVLGKVF